MVYIRELTEVLVVPHPDFGLESFKVLCEEGDDSIDIKVLINRVTGIAHSAYVLISGGRLLGAEEFAPDAGVYMLPHHVYLQEDPLEKKRRSKRNAHDKQTYNRHKRERLPKRKNIFSLAPCTGVR